MKKSGILLLLIIGVFLVSCSFNQNYNSMLGTVIKDEEQWMFLEERGIKRFYIEDPHVPSGAKVEISYKGHIAKGSPSRFSQKPKIKVLEERDDYYGFYKDLLRQIWEEDQALNYRVKTIYYDLSEVKSLTQAEKNWLMISFQDEIDKKPMSLPDILSDKKFSDEYGNIRNGVHIEISDEINKGDLITKYGKTRANLGAKGGTYRSKFKNGKWKMIEEGQWAS